VSWELCGGDTVETNVALEGYRLVLSSKKETMKMSWSSCVSKLGSTMRDLLVEREVSEIDEFDSTT
jgi:hypothetical protein